MLTNRPVAVAALNAREPNNDGGSIGFSPCTSRIAKHPAATAARANPPSTGALAKPFTPPSIIAPVSATSATIAASCPPRSSPRSFEREVSLA
jgi:hypothetical protein